MIRSTMSESPLTINAVLRHGRRVHADSECVTFTGDGVRRASYGQVADNADRLAAALQRLGVGPGDPVGTFMWNDQEHSRPTSPSPAWARCCTPSTSARHPSSSCSAPTPPDIASSSSNRRSFPWDGSAVGEIEVRGPWITASYWQDPAAEKFHDGWLRTGDVGTVTPNGYMQITDRAKDAAVIGIPDPRWDERPVACVVAAGETDPTGLKQFLTGYVAKWQVPENWAFVDVIPKTSVGKFDKKALRTQHEKGDLAPRRV
jgi:acyl-CoA synthetase (AMP-forming)/AMP-acid ligase II